MAGGSAASRAASGASQSGSATPSARVISTPMPYAGTGPEVSTTRPGASSGSTGPA